MSIHVVCFYFPVVCIQEELIVLAARVASARPEQKLVMSIDHKSVNMSHIPGFLIQSTVLCKVAKVVDIFSAQYFIFVGKCLDIIIVWEH